MEKEKGTEGRSGTRKREEKRSGREWKSGREWQKNARGEEKERKRLEERGKTRRELINCHYTKPFLYKFLIYVRCITESLYFFSTNSKTRFITDVRFFSMVEGKKYTSACFTSDMSSVSGQCSQFSSTLSIIVLTSICIRILILFLYLLWTVWFLF